MFRNAEIVYDTLNILGSCISGNHVQRHINKLHNQLTTWREQSYASENNGLSISQ
jgi:hypothetical protein